MTIKFTANTTISGHTYFVGDVVKFAAADEGNQVNLGNAAYFPATASVTTSVNVLAQSGIPFILPGNGTMAASGALTLGTALAATYPDAYLYFPATTFSGSSTAGWYYTVMSSTTVGTCYGNTYSSGTATIPTNPVAIVGAGSSYTQTTGSLLAGPQYPMTAGQMGNNGNLHVRFTEANNNSAGTKTFAIVLGASSLVTNTATTATGKSMFTDTYNAGKAAKQWTTADAAAGTAATASSTEDTAVAKTISISLQLGTATDTVQISSHAITLTPS